MKKIIAGLLCAATVSGAVFAQEATFYNKVGTTAVRKEAVEESKPYMADIYDEVRGTYDSEKFSIWGQVKLSVVPAGKGKVGDVGDGPWETGVNTKGDIELALAFRPVEFLEVIAGNVAGGEGLWGASYLPGFYGYGSDISYGVREWANGEGLTVAFKGAGIGVDGLTIGWNVLQGQEGLLFKAGDDKKLGWKTAFGVTYAIPELVSIGAGARINTREDSSQEFGIGAEITAIENLKIGLGFDMHTETKELTLLDENLSWGKADFTAMLNAGAEYNFAGMNLPLLVGADFGMVMGKKKTEDIDNAPTIMPMTIGAFVAFNVLENLTLDARFAYASNMHSESSGKGHKMIIEPRVWFNLTEADELRLDVPITNIKSGDNSATGFDVELYWKHNF